MSLQAACHCLDTPHFFCKMTMTNKSAAELIQNVKPTKARHLKKGPLALAKFLVDLFAQVKPRSPPSSTKTRHGRLITITPSHFCEKGRWGLDLVENDPGCDFYYSEDGHPPAFSSLAAVPASKDVASQTPMVLLDGGEVIYGSDAVLKRFCPFLYPQELQQEMEELEKDLHQRLGTTMRLYAYHHMLQEGYYDALCDVCTCQTSKVEAMLFRNLISKGIDRGLRKFMELNDANAVLAKATLEQVFEEISQRLKNNGGKYIMDTPTKSYGFTAIDLTFASLAYLLIRPPELRAFQCETDRIPPHVLDFCHELASTEAGQHVLRMYREHRFGTFGSPERSNGRLVLLRQGPRDRLPWVEVSMVIGGFVALGILVQNLF